MSGEKSQNCLSVVFGGMMVQIVLGTVYAFSAFVKPLELEFGLYRATTVGLFVCLGFFCNHHDTSGQVARSNWT